MLNIQHWWRFLHHFSFSWWNSDIFASARSDNWWTRTWNNPFLNLLWKQPFSNIIRNGLESNTEHPTHKWRVDPCQLSRNNTSIMLTPSSPEKNLLPKIACEPQINKIHPKINKCLFRHPLLNQQPKKQVASVTWPPVTLLYFKESVPHENLVLRTWFRRQKV